MLCVVRATGCRRPRSDTGPGCVCQPNEPPGSTTIDVTSMSFGPCVLIWIPLLDVSDSAWRSSRVRAA